MFIYVIIVCEYYIQRYMQLKCSNVGIYYQNVRHNNKVSDVQKVKVSSKDSVE